jgi:hypothetical protein
MQEEETTLETSNESNESANTVPTNVENTNLIKPKYIKDKTVFYKNSGYLKDLLGEDN